MARATGLMRPEIAEVSPRETHLRDYWKIVWQGRWTVGVVFLAVTGATLAWTLLQTPIYRATATVEIQAQARRVAPGQEASGLGAAGYGFFAEEKYQNTQMEVIKSRAVAQRAFETLSLGGDPRFKGLDDPIGAFIRLINVEPRRDTGLIEISIEGSDRDEVTRWVNAIADTYVERNLETAKENARRAVNQIEKMMTPLREGVLKAETQRYEFLGQIETYSPENQQQIITAKLQKLNADLTETQTKVAKLGSLLAKIQEVKDSDGNPMMIPELAQDAVLQDMNKERARWEQELDKARVTMRPGNPAYQETESQLKRVTTRMRDQMSTKKGQMQSEYELAQRNEQTLQAEIRSAEQTAYKLGLTTSKFSLFNTDAETKKELFDVINKTMQQVALGAELLANNVSLLDHAVPPLSPVSPKKRLNLFMGAMLGLLLGLGAAFFMDYLDNTFRSPEDIEQYLGMTTLAIVPKWVDEEAGSHSAKEAFQSLRTSLIFSSKNRERKVVLVTSCAPQEGKSSTVAQLSLALAGPGDRVLVLDCDLRRPTLHLHFQVARDAGLTEYLAAPRGVEDWTPYVKRTAVPNLDVVTCGPIPPNAPELLGSDRFRRLLVDLRGQYDWVVIDSPPVMSLADAVILAAQADMVALIIRHNRTDRERVARGFQQLRNVGANVVGAILNNVDVRRGYQKDYYYAGYYYYTSREDGGGERRKKSASGERKGVGTGAGV